VSAVARTLREWLAAQPVDALTGLLGRRPDAVAPPTPQHLAELADRLQTPASVTRAVQELPLPGLQIIEVLQLLGPDGGYRTALLDWLGYRPGPDGAPPAPLATLLRLLSDWALVWPDGDQLRMAEPLYDVFPYPLRLGAPASVLLARHPYDRLRAIARTLGVPPPGRKAHLVTAISTAVSDPERVRKLVANAAPAIRDRLMQLAESGPEATSPWYGHRPEEPALRWATAHGLAMTDQYGVPQLAREAALALRGPDWRAPFTPEPPPVPTTEVGEEAVAREAAAAGGAAVGQLSGLLEAIAAEPCPLVKSGGVGVRELRRLARRLGTDEAPIRLWLVLAHHAGLLAVHRNGRDPARLLPTAEYDRWAELVPAQQLAELLGHWLRLPTVPLRPVDGRPTVALGSAAPGPHTETLRRRLLAWLATLPTGQAVADPEALWEALAWHHPLLTTAPGVSADLMTAVWHEAHLLGVVARGALSPLGAALQAGTDPALPARSLLPPPVTEAVFQADLTAVVPGPVDRSLADLLDSVADRESTGSATSWRFSPDSVRRALDAGHSVAALQARLRQRAVGGTLPQPLEYLLTDVARRHGHVRLREVGCVLRADDPALLAELVAARSLRRLALSVLAPTVLASAAPLAETLAALRAAGYAPIQESADGVPVLDRPPRHRATPPRRRPTTPPTLPPAAPADLAALAARLHAAAVPVATAPDPVDSAASAPPEPVPITLAQQTGQLRPDERWLLWAAIRDGTPVVISYVNAEGVASTRVVEDLELDGDLLHGWCRLRGAERVFALRRISAVTAAEELS